MTTTEYSEYYLEKLSDENDVDLKDEKLVYVIFDSIIAVMACLYVDLELYNKNSFGRGMEGYDISFRNAWNAESVSGYWFVQIRDQAGFGTYKKFYEELSIHCLSDFDLDNIERMYERWCEGTKPRLKQWQYLAGVDTEKEVLNEELFRIRSEYLFLELLEILKSKIDEYEADWNLEIILERLDFWCKQIKDNISWEEWQSCLTAKL